jgi:hypothetical protein
MASRRSWVRIPSAPPNPQKLNKNAGSFVTVARTVAQLEKTGAENQFVSVLSEIEKSNMATSVMLYQRLNKKARYALIPAAYLRREEDGKW